jgi:hypothetical protein
VQKVNNLPLEMPKTCAFKNAACYIIPANFFNPGTADQLFMVENCWWMAKPYRHAI